MKAVTKELNTGQHHQATQTLVRIGLALSQIRLQKRFKNIVLLGGVEQALMAMMKETSMLEKRHFHKVHSLVVSWCRVILR